MAAGNRGDGVGGRARGAGGMKAPSRRVATAPAGGKSKLGMSAPGSGTLSGVKTSKSDSGSKAQQRYGKRS